MVHLGSLQSITQINIHAILVKLSLCNSILPPPTQTTHSREVKLHTPIHTDIHRRTGTYRDIQTRVYITNVYTVLRNVSNC